MEIRSKRVVTFRRRYTEVTTRVVDTQKISEWDYRQLWLAQEKRHRKNLRRYDNALFQGGMRIYKA